MALMPPTRSGLILRRNSRNRELARKEGAGIVAATIAAVGAVLAAAVMVAPSLLDGEASPLPSNVTCSDVHDRYEAKIAKNAVERERILPGADGQSALLRDPLVKYCGIIPEDFS
jgi:hypothetical protein